MTTHSSEASKLRFFICFYYNKAMETRIHRYAFFTLLIIISALLFWITKPYLLAIFWAIVLAITFNPINQWLARKIKWNGIRTSLSVLIVALILIVPVTFLGNLVLKETSNLYDKLADDALSGTTIRKNATPFIEKIENNKYIAPLIGDTKTLEAEINRVVRSGIQYLTQNFFTFTQNVVHLALVLFIMMYTLAYIFKDGTRLRTKIIDTLPLDNQKTNTLFKKFASITRATVKGTFFVAFIQGLIGGILFLIAGIPAPVLWGCVIMVVSIIPAVGTGIIWFPAGLILLATGNYAGGLAVLIGGALVISVVDNILRPRLVGKDTELPDTLILLTTLGGITTFGIAGVILGPLIAGFFVATWEMFRVEYK